MICAISSLVILLLVGIDVVHGGCQSSGNPTSSKDPTSFRGYEDRIVSGSCSDKGVLRSAMCWTDDCGGSVICSDVKPVCLCYAGYSGSTCQTTAPTGSTTVSPTKDGLAIPHTFSGTETSLLCSMKMCNRVSNKLITPGAGFDVTSAKATNKAVFTGSVELVPPSADDAVKVNTYISQSKAQYFSSMPLRFSGVAVAPYAAGLLPSATTTGLLTGNTWVTSDITVTLGTLKASNSNTITNTTAEFKAAVANLPVSYDATTRSSFEKFLSTFGTHVVVSAKVGVRAITSIAVPLCGDPLVIQNTTNAFANEMVRLASGQNPDTSFISEIVGGPPSIDTLRNAAGGFTAWLSQVTPENAVRMDVELVRISDSRFLTDPIKRDALEQALNNMAASDLSLTKDPCSAEPSSTLSGGSSSSQSPGMVVGVVVGCGVAFGLLVLVAIKMCRQSTLFSPSGKMKNPIDNNFSMAEPTTQQQQKQLPTTTTATAVTNRIEQGQGDNGNHVVNL
eukprot:PhF_6_TR9178/c0_g1_i1/m.14309